MATITYDDGIQEEVLVSVDEQITDDDTYEFILWHDGSLSIESVEYAITGEGNHARIPLQTALKLRDFLTSDRVTQVLFELM